MGRKATVLIVGGGGREHSIAWKLAQSPRVGKLYAAPGNAGIAQVAQCLPVGATDLDGIVRAAQEVEADLVVVGPDDPLAMGLVDRLQAAGLRAFGPSQAAARVEASKSFAKSLMEKYGIPTARYQTVTSLEAARAAIQAHFAATGAPLVVKADGLALGKGVTIARTPEAAWEAAEGMLSGRLFGDAGKCVVLEEFLTGPEVSVLAFADGKNVIPMAPAQDHKQVYDGDQGPNTGGMGTISPVPACDAATAERITREVLQPAIAGMAAEGCPFVGCLFAGLMLTPGGPKVLEFNARFGDPETQVVLRRLQDDLYDVLEACAAGPEAGGGNGGLHGARLAWSGDAAACVIMASGGYPGDYKKGLPITGIDAAERYDGVAVFHAGTAKSPQGDLVTAGGRVLGVSALGADLNDALGRAYRAVEQIHFEGAHYRRDIGRRQGQACC